MDTPDPDNPLAPVEDAICRGRKIEAIKRYREAFGTGLAEAKKAVEDLEKDLRLAAPERFTSGPSGSGCLGVIIVGLTAIATLAAFKA